MSHTSYIWMNELVRKPVSRARRNPGPAAPASLLTLWGYGSPEHHWSHPKPAMMLQDAERVSRLPVVNLPLVVVFGKWQLAAWGLSATFRLTALLVFLFAQMSRKQPCCCAVALLQPHSASNSVLACILVPHPHSWHWNTEVKRPRWKTRMVKKCLHFQKGRGKAFHKGACCGNSSIPFHLLSFPFAQKMEKVIYNPCCFLLLWNVIDALSYTTIIICALYFVKLSKKKSSMTLRKNDWIVRQVGRIM